jgi:solute carrier family 35 protein F5
MSVQQSLVPPAMAEEFVAGFPEQQERNSISSTRSTKAQGFRAGVGLGHIARRSLGIFLLLVTVFLWTASNFLASVSCVQLFFQDLADMMQYMFADNTYSKPYFVTYINTAMFAFSLIPIFFRLAHQHGVQNLRTSVAEYWKGGVDGYMAIGKSTDVEEEAEDSMSASQTRLLVDENGAQALSMVGDPQGPEDMLTVRETAWLSLEFCLLWFVANYLVAACLEYTSVASSTILTSTSSVWTLFFGAVMRVETFSYRKLIGVLASLAGIILISSVDLGSPDNDEHRGKFPHKTQAEIAVGDLMAFGSAIMYGLYAIVMKKRIGNEDRVNMPLFFGLVGLFNVLFLWPGFVILNLAGIEEFQLPPTGHIWTIVLVSSIAALP